MKKQAYRRRKTIQNIILILFTFIFFVSCEDDEKINYPDPGISIIINPEYVYSDTIISVGQNIKVGIKAEYNGHNYLTNFIAKVNGERYVDLGLYAESYTKEVDIIKGLDDIENWEFIIRDIEGNSASTSLTISKNQNVEYGEIDEYLNIQLGAQNSTEYGSFFSLSTGLVYTLEEACKNSEQIDMAAYYDNFDKLEEWIMASPGANIGETAFPGLYALSNWETINTTRYSREKLSITVEEFDNASNDSILIANSFAFESGGRKSKYLEPGDMYSFVRGSRTGIFKVVSTTGTTNGNVVIDIKIQK